MIVKIEDGTTVVLPRDTDPDAVMTVVYELGRGFWIHRLDVDRCVDQRSREPYPSYTEAVRAVRDQGVVWAARK